MCGLRVFYNVLRVFIDVPSLSICVYRFLYSCMYVCIGVVQPSMCVYTCGYRLSIAAYMSLFIGVR